VLGRRSPIRNDLENRKLIGMIINYLKTSFRTLLRNKIFSFINIFGLAIGMAACLLIMLWIQDEMNFDTFHKNRDKIYRVMTYGEDFSFDTSPAKLGLQLAMKIPEIEKATLFEGVEDVLFQFGEKGFYQDGGIIADSSFFNFFDFEFVEGDPNHLFSNANEIVINEDLAHKLFGEKQALASVITVDGEAFKIVGVIKNVPYNSSIDFKFLIPFDYSKTNGSAFSWGRFMFSNFVQVNEHANIDSIGKQLTRYAAEQKCPQVLQNRFVFKLQAFSKVHLDGAHGSWREYYNLTDKKYVIAFSVIAIFILINACFNYINLSTVRSEKRSKEVAVRKVLGANFQNLFKQFIGESLLTTFISTVFALILLELGRSVFSSLANKALIIEYASFNFIGSVLLLFLITGLLAGSYPALMMSSYSPMNILRKSTQKMGTGIFRNILVIIQFFVASVLIIGSVIILRQLNYVKNKDLGFDNKNIVVIPFMENLPENYTYLKSKLLQDPNIVSVTASSYLWANDENRCAGCFYWEGLDWDNPTDFHVPIVDFDYFKTLGITMVNGRDFSSSIPSDSTSAVLINETGAKAIGLENPVGMSASFGGFSETRRSVTVVGIFPDFNYGSLERKIEAQVVRIITNPKEIDRSGVMLVRINGANREQAINTIEASWNEVNHLIPFEYQFLDEIYSELYKKDRNMARLVIYFTLFSILIACLGILGMTIFVCERKTKETGIRKVIGANVGQLIWTITGKFIAWISVAFFIAVPVSYLLMEEVLKQYAYRINIAVQDYLIALIIIVFVSLSSSIILAYKAASSNPVDALKYD
jgi:putative ABC transport system permease protein